MRWACTLILAVVVSLAAQEPEPAEIRRARGEVERVRALVEAGVAPAQALRQAEAELVRARDHLVLERTLYGRLTVDELTEEQSREMIQAAERQLESQQREVDEAKKRVEEGVMPRISLGPPLEELDRRRKTLELATARANLLRELAVMARNEQAAAEDPAAERPGTPPVAERFDGDGVFLASQWKTVLLAFEKRFRKPAPVSARGATAVHRALGFDHSGRIDIALDPDTEEGQWLLQFLEQERIPYYAFRGYVRGKSTAAHIHIGPPSPRASS